MSVIFPDYTILQEKIQNKATVAAQPVPVEHKPTPPAPADYDEMAVIEYKLATGGVLNNSELLSYLLSLK